jgi:hypothetical protein
MSRCHPVARAVEFANYHDSQYVGNIAPDNAVRIESFFRVKTPCGGFNLFMQFAVLQASSSVNWQNSEAQPVTLPIRQA